MSIRLGDEAPDFTAETTEGTIDFHQWKDGKWAVLFSHPADFTPVCTTELGRTASLKSEFDQRGVRVMGVSVDPVESHNSWAQDITDVGGTDLNFPLIADQDRQVSELYDMIHPGEGDTSTVRSVFIVDPENKVRLTLTYPKSIGRNFGEIMRVIDALQLTDAAPVSTPVDWQPGDRIIVAPTMSTDDARQRFEDVEEVRPYLRWAKQPQT
ncbi:MAG TPA: peroxiredoxin [Streptosporangiaceae bacterium]|jgi:alkyl hydroperoxide reductase subunit AhpC|nr:peroxiredoxin [Streptosporangiaceae bacterium]